MKMTETLHESLPMNPTAVRTRRESVLRLIATTALLCIAIAGSAKSAAADVSTADGRFTVKEGLIYSQAGPQLTMDLFLPEAAARKAVPCVIVIQGGGFNAQDGQKFRPFAVYLAERGFAAALIAYRGRPNHRYRDTISDTKTAVRFVRKISESYNIDSDRIGAMGGSAGGALAGLLAMTGGMEQLEGGREHLEFSSRVQAAVAYAGVFDFVARFTDEQQIALQPKVESKIKENGAWIGPTFSRTNQHWLTASCINHIDRKDPPMLLIHSKDDSTVPWLQSQDMYERMRKAGIQSEIKYYERGGHGFQNKADEPKADMVRFFAKRLLNNPKRD